MEDKKFQEIKKVREKDINDFAYDNLRPKEANELMNCIYDYYTIFEEQLLSKTDENTALKQKLDTAVEALEKVESESYKNIDNAKSLVRCRLLAKTALEKIKGKI